MGILANENAISSGNYLISNSLRFQSASSQYLSRTPASTTNQKTFTWSGWVKRGVLSADETILGTADSGSFTQNIFIMRFTTTDTIRIIQTNSSGSASLQFDTTAVFRDPSAWYHVVLYVDTTQATNSNGLRLYINNVLQSGTYAAYTQNTNTSVNSTAFTMYHGRYGIISPAGYFDGYMAEVNFIDGQALTPSSFGTTDATSGQWVAKKYTGTYGTNGFYLPFSNGTSTTTLGADSSGNGNNWTLTNFTRSAGTSDCWMYDVPSGNGGASGTQPSSNYADINPLIKGSYSVVSNANLKVTGSTGNSYNSVMSTIGMTSGKWYCEVTATSAGGSPAIGICLNTQTLGAGGATAGYVGDASGGYSYFTDGSKFHNATQTTGYGATWTTGDVIGVAFDADAGSITFYKNNVSQGVAYSSISMTQPWFFGVSTYLTTDTFNINFGQRSFAYTPPSGFKALCTANLPVATIKQGNKYMDATLYTGNITSLTVTNAGGFKPDLVWCKARGTPQPNALFDSVRGVSLWLCSNTTAAETSNSGVTSFNSNGFSVGASQTANDATSMVGWQWQAGQGTTSSNTQGSITSTVSVNTTAGFSIVTWTSQASGTATVGHGLGVAPKMIITKIRNTANAWLTYHASLGATNYVSLNTTNASASSATVWNSTSPTSSVMSFGTDWAASYSMVAYCFAEIAGFSKFGSYTGNGSANGPFVYLGFRPKYVLVKRTDTTGNWPDVDSSRSPYNSTVAALFPNLSNAEGNYSAGFDLLSNGFKLREPTNNDINTNGGTYIYMAFAENPFAQSNAR